MNLSPMDNNLKIYSGAISDRGLSEKRPENQDAFIELGQYGIYGVADGVGGAQAGEVASQMAVEILGEAFANLSPAADAESVMKAAIERANASIYQMAQDLPKLATMATTVVALHLNGNIATIGHVGDSRLYRVDKDGNFFRETDDHSMVAEEVRAGRMTEEQAENHPSRNIISRALGAEPTVVVDLKTIMIEGGTAFLICSDGITRHVSDQEIKGVLTFGGSPDDICEYLKNLCYHRGAEDNLTAVVVKTSSDQAGQVLGGEARSNVDIDSDEATVTSVRETATRPAPIDDADDLLELDTIPGITADQPEEQVEVDELDGHETIPGEPISFSESSNDEPNGFSSPEADGIDHSPAFVIEPAPEAREHGDADISASNESQFSMFGNSGDEEPEPEKGSFSKTISAIGFVVLGAVLGIGAYYFAMAPKPVDTDGPQLSEMRSANIPLSAFEENRRNVDKDPTNYIARFGQDPQDSEDHYLLGRAYLLTGSYAQARTSLIEARNRLPEADPSNAAVLASDIAMALAVTNDTTIQSMLRKELEGNRPQLAEPGNAITNTGNLNANTAP